MAFYLVRARLRPELAVELRDRLERGDFARMRPFGRSLTRSLENARVDATTGDVVWEEEDYCLPPLAQERAAVLDRYFVELRVERVEKGEGWSRLEELGPLWEERS